MTLREYLTAHPEDGIFAIAAGLLLLSQVLVCFFAKKAWARWLPFEVNLLLMVLCFVLYGLSRWTNWGFLILLGVLMSVLAVQGLILFAVWLIRKFLKK